MTDVPAGVVLYRPDVAILTRLLGPLAQGGRPLLVFVNGPLEPACAQLLASIPTAQVLESAENVGLGAGLNAICAAAAAGFNHVMLFDQDSEPTPEMPEQLRDRLLAQTAQGQRVACVGPLLLPPDGENYRRVRYFWRGSPGDTPLAAAVFVPTSGSLICLAALAAIGPFRDDFFIGGIDVEWSFRAWSRGHACLVARDLPMPHRCGDPTDATQRPGLHFLGQSRTRRYFYIRNSVYCLRLPHIPLAWRVRSVAVMLAQTGLLALREAERLRNLTVISAGLRDGIFGRLGPIPPSLG